MSFWANYLRYVFSSFKFQVSSDVFSLWSSHTSCAFLSAIFTSLLRLSIIYKCQHCALNQTATWVSECPQRSHFSNKSLDSVTVMCSSPLSVLRFISNFPSLSLCSEKNERYHKERSSPFPLLAHFCCCFSSLSEKKLKDEGERLRESLSFEQNWTEGLPAWCGALEGAFSCTCALHVPPTPLPACLALFPVDQDPSLFLCSNKTL